MRIFHPSKKALPTTSVAVFSRCFQHRSADIQNRIFIHSVLGWGSICICIWHGDSLWHCWSAMEAQVALIATFSSSVLLGLVSRIFLLTMPLRFFMGFRSGKLAGQSSTVMSWSVQLGRCKDLQEKGFSISINLVSRQEHEVLQNLRVNGCIGSRLDKTPADDMAPKNNHWLWKRNPGL